MPQRLSISKLSASEVTAPARQRFRNELLRSPAASWPREINYLRKLYSDIQKTASDARLFSETEPRIRELLIGLQRIAQRIPDRPNARSMVTNAQHDFETASAYEKKANHEMADVYASYSLLKVSSVLDGFATLANKRVKAYGYDISGQVMEPGEQESRSPNLWDQANSPKNNKTPVNPANSGVDAEAESDFPELEEKHERVEWPARTR